MPVHYAGHPCDLAALEEICREHDLRLVEDAAHATETRARQRPQDRRGRRHHVLQLLRQQEPRGRRGRDALPADEELAARLLAAAARPHAGLLEALREEAGPGAYDVVEPGYKLNLWDLHAGVALGQLHRLEEHHERRVAQADATTRASRASPGSRRSGGRLPSRAASTASTCTSCGSLGRSREPIATTMRTALSDEGIGTGLRFLAGPRAGLFRSARTRPVAAGREAGRAPRCCRCRSPRRTRSQTSTTPWRRVRKVHAHYAGNEPARKMALQVGLSVGLIAAVLWPADPGPHRRRAAGLEPGVVRRRDGLNVVVTPRDGLPLAAPAAGAGPSRRPARWLFEPTSSPC